MRRKAALAFLILALLAGSCAPWKEFKFDDLGFRVQAPPDFSCQSLKPFEDRILGKAETYVCLGEGTFEKVHYEVDFTKYDGKHYSKDFALSYVDAVKAQTVKPFTITGAADAFETDSSFEDKDVEGRIVFATGRIYRPTAFVPRLTNEHDNVERFFNSFALLDQAATTRRPIDER